MTAAIVVLSPIGSPGQQFFDNNGVLLAGGLLYTYAAGTTTPATTYTDSTGNTANANPIVLDSAGRVTGGCWLVSGTGYKIVLKTSAGSTLGTWDHITMLFGATAAQVVSIAANTAAIVVINETKSGFLAYRSASLTLSGAGVAHTVPFDTEVYDTLSEFNVSTGIWTPTVAGKYLLSFGFSSESGIVLGTYIYKNGAIDRVLGQLTLDAVVSNGTSIFSVTAGETYNVSIIPEAGSVVVQTGLAATWFAAQYLGP